MRIPHFGKGIVAGALIALVPAAEAGTISNGNDTAVTIGGNVNRALLWADDGKDSEVFVVDNENLSSRFFIAGESPINERVKAGFLLEVDFRDNSSSTVTIDDGTSGGGPGDNGVGATSFSQRHMDAYVDHATFGKLSIGQGATASDGSAEADSSGTGIVAYSGVADMAGAIKFRTAAGGLGPAIGDVSSNMDGLGLDDRVRYDTPSFNGFGLSASMISGGGGDVGGSFSGKFGGFNVGAAAAYWNNASLSTTLDGGVAGSLSVKHDTGLSLTLAGGQQFATATGRDDPSYGYGKLAYTVSLSSVGDTSFGLDYGIYNDVAQDGDEMTTIGVQAVQELASAGTSLYAAYRHHSLDRTGTNYDDISAVMTGISVAF